MSSPGSESASDCLVCREVAGDAELPGGPIPADEVVVGFHVPPLEDDPAPYLGHLIAVPRRHVPGWAELTDGEAGAVGVAIARLARTLSSTLDAERVYSATVGHRVPHLHVHVFPRYKGTPPEIAWTQSGEWEGAPHGGAEAIAELVARLRAALA